MKAKVPKCYSLAIQASTAQQFDPKLYLNDQSIPFVGNRTIKFLGGPIQVPGLGTITSQLDYARFG